jgi:hypothetical protein
MMDKGPQIKNNIVIGRVEGYQLDDLQKEPNISDANIKRKRKGCRWIWYNE